MGVKVRGGIFILTLKAEFNDLKISEAENPLYTSGSVNVYKVKFDFSDEWDGLTAIPVFKIGDFSVSADILNDAEWKEQSICTIPWEIFAKEHIGKRIYAGLVGMDSENYVVTTVYAFIGHLVEGAAEADMGNGPTPSIVQQMIAAVEDIGKRVGNIEDTLEEGGIEIEGKKTSFYEYAFESGYSGTEDEFKSDLADIGEYASLPSSYNSGNLMEFDESGNIKDSGKSKADFSEKTHTHDGLHTHSNKSVLDGIAGISQSLGSSENKIPSEKAVSEAIGNAGGGDMLSDIYDKEKKKEDIFSYADKKVGKPESSTSGNLMEFDESGNAKDSGKSKADFSEKNTYA